MTGGLFLLLGLGIAQWHAALFRRVGTNIHTFRPPDFLLRRGLFRVSRNPMYLGFVVALVGVALALGSLWSAIIVPLYALLVDRWYVAYEERALTARFGAEYAAYRREVRRWL